ncbi:mitochondrial intermediate peptidase [Plasmodium gonderi]|uniref:Mitochondrial intermediate peptidase n=1 Tax=Plasmodium gonderi TaxID=77519 RepID=A0A1Y1JKM7_PLAGO|nr:mitochondrial intermediate peptidase [Plasmodium gonderi]GAW82198.1 mitochondrial intermediate peptidase [Plasmodium gonderi]
MNHKSYNLVYITCNRRIIKTGTWKSFSRIIHSRNFKRNFFFQNDTDNLKESFKFLEKINLKNLVKKGNNKSCVKSLNEENQKGANCYCELLCKSEEECLQKVDKLNDDDIERVDNILNNVNSFQKKKKKYKEGYLLELIGIRSNGENITEASLACIGTCDNILKRMCKEKNIFKIINMVDTVSNNLCKLGDALELLRNLHNNQKVIAKAHDAMEKLTTYIDRINIDEQIYYFLKKKYEQHVHMLDREHREVLLNMIMSMENQGVHIKEEKKKCEYLELQAQEKYFSFHAASNFSNEYDGFFIQKNKLMPFIDEHVIHNYQQKIKPFIESNRIKINTTDDICDTCQSRRDVHNTDEYVYLLQDSPFIMTILENVNNENIAKRSHALLKKPNQIFLKNILILQYYRNMLARFRNFKNYSEYALKNCILNSPDKVNYFLKKFLNKILPYFFEELQFIEKYIDLTSSKSISEKGTSFNLSAVHHSANVTGEAKKIDSQNNNLVEKGMHSKLTPENLFYHMNQIRKEKLKKIEAQMNNSLRLYDVIKFVMKLLKNSYSLDMVNILPLSNELWDENILKFEIKEGNYTYGYLYMDLFERENKSHSIAQYTVRCSKNMNTCLKYKWFEDDVHKFPFFYTGIVKDDLYISTTCNNIITAESNSVKKIDTQNCSKIRKQIYRQTTSTFLVCNFNINLNDHEETDSKSNSAEGNIFINENITKSLGKIKMSIDKVNMFVHEFGHALHCILSSTYLQHLSGNRGGVDFSEFSSHFFEEYLNSYDALLLLYGKEEKEGDDKELLIRETTKSIIKQYLKNKNILCYYSIMQLTIQSIIDQIFYCLSHESSSITVRNELIEKEINTYFSGIYYKNIFILDLFPQIHFSKTTHLVHYPANYFCYLYCSVLSKYVWNRTFKDNLMNQAKAADIVNFMRGGSTDSSLKNIIALVEEDTTKIQYYTENPQHLPLDDFLEHYSGGNKNEEYNSFLQSL